MKVSSYVATRIPCEENSAAPRRVEPPARARSRVLFVSRERVRLPLDGAQKRKWDAIGDVLEYRVLAAAPQPATVDEHFLLDPRTRRRPFEGVAFYLRLPLRIARELRAYRPAGGLVQGIPEATASLITLRLASDAAKLHHVAPGT